MWDEMSMHDQSWGWTKGGRFNSEKCKIILGTRGEVEDYFLPLFFGFLHTAPLAAGFWWKEITQELWLLCDLYQV